MDKTGETNLTEKILEAGKASDVTEISEAFGDLAINVNLEDIMQSKYSVRLSLQQWAIIAGALDLLDETGLETYQLKEASEDIRKQLFE